MTQPETSDSFARLDALLEGSLDLHIDMDTATGCGWSCRIAVVTANPDDRAARAHTVYAAGPDSAEAALGRALDELERWLAESPVSHQHPWVSEMDKGDSQ